MRSHIATILATLIIALMALPTTLNAQDPLANGSSATSPDPLSSSTSNSLSSNGLDQQDDEYLDPEVAYLLSFDLQENAIALHWDIEPEYYLYRDMFKFRAYSDGKEISIRPDYSKGKVKYDEFSERDRELYYVSADVNFTVPADIRALELAVGFQGCAPGLCFPPKTNYFEIDLDQGTAQSIAALTAKPESSGGNGNGLINSGAANNNFEGSTFSLYTLLIALIGGVILNLMPCVFPVLSIKALSFISSSGSSHSHHVHGWVYTAGAVASFLAIGGIIIGIRALGGDADWGKQLQSPIFVALMFYLFLVMGLSLSGFVHFGSSMMGIGQSLTTRQGLQGSFFTGVLAVVVASPCTAPFMAPALGVALTQSPPIALSVFAALGLGMALPFLLLSYSPKLAALLPKPGAWMETLKQFLAFPLYITAVWLLWVLGRQTSVDAAAVVVLGAIAIAFSIWLMQRKPKNNTAKMFVYSLTLVSVVTGFGLAVKAKEFGKSEFWQPYSAELVADLRNSGQPVFVNLTAAWCITCHANERVALSRDAVKEAAKELNIGMVKGDWTNEDPRITALMHEYRRSGVPLYLMFPADTSLPAEVLPQFLTQDTVLEAMQRAANSSVASR